MFSAISNFLRLAHAGLVLVRHGARVIPEDVALPEPVRIFKRIWPQAAAKAGGRQRGVRGNETRLAAALTSLGPSYVKLGQFLATRDDIVGRELARDLSRLQDRLPPFSNAEAERTVEDALGAKVSELYEEFGPSVAAASIAQVHRAKVRNGASHLRDVAVKILRPRVETRFGKDLESYYFAARAIERLHPASRRLRPVAVVDTLAKSVAIEMDLRMEAAAISEMAENIAGDDGFRVPKVDWSRSAKRVLTLEWIDGIPLSDHAALKAAGHDLERLGDTLIQSFLRHAMRDGFFHADMHPGNLFVDVEGDIVAVDFGIMGRLTKMERRFLAEILYGFITRDYRRVSEVHFEAGYVPRKHSIDQFAQALRAIGEPLMDRTAEEISMAQLLGQLLQYTDVFDMQTQPQLILLQKTMVVVEGVGRMLNPKLNIWATSEPVVRGWIENEMGAEARLAEAADGAASVGHFIGEIPRLLAEGERAAGAFATMAEDGLRLDTYSIDRLADAQAKRNRFSRLAIWLAALSLAAIAVSLLT